MRKNMNRATVIIILAIFLTISVGYALFSDTITIEGTATAQGNFDIEVSECYPGILSGVDSDYINAYVEKGYANDKCEITSDGNKVTFNVDFLELEAARHFTVKLTNTGDIDGMIDLSLIDSTNQSNLKQVVCYDGKNGLKNGVIDDEEECLTNESNDVFANNLHGTAAIEEPDGNFIYMSEENKQSVIGKYAIVKNDTIYVNLPPNGSIYLIYSVKLKKNLEYHPAFAGNSLLARNTFSYTYDFVQTIK